MPSRVDRHCSGFALQEVVDVSPKHKNWIAIIFALPWTPFLRSIHSLRRGLPGRFTKKCSKVLGCGPHGFGCAAIGAACGRPPGLTYILYRHIPCAGGCQGGLQKIARNASGCGPHGFGCAAMGASCGRPPRLSYIFYPRHY